MAGNSWGGSTVGTNYRGTRAAAPPNWNFEERNPTQYDRYNYVLGDLWLNKTTEQIWVLVSLRGDMNSRGELATWIEWGGALKTLTGDTGGPVEPDVNKNINTLGTPGQIDVTGNPATNTLTWSLDGSIATEYVENSGSAIPALGILNVLGDTGITTTGFGNTITIDVEGEVALSYPTDSGTAVPAANVLNIFGGTAGRDINTTGSGNTVRVHLNNAITVGDLADITGNPAVTATTGDITITAGNLNMSGTVADASAGIINAGGTRFVSNYGIHNTFIGSGSGNTTLTYLNAVQNTGVGQGALDELTTGINNSAIGVASGGHITSGANNCILAGAINLTTGSNNVMIGGGDAAGLLTGVTTGSNNTFVGVLTASNYTGAESDNILIGYSTAGTVGETNTCRIGLATGTDPGELNQTFISGIRGITTGVNDAVAVLVDSANQLGTVSSSIRYKENVNDMGSSSDVLMKLRPVTFNYKNDESKSTRFGLIAEEVKEVFPYLAVHNAEGEVESVKYHEIAAILLNEVQKLQKRIEILEAKI